MKHLFIGLSILFVAFSVRADLQTDMINDKLERLDREMTLLQKKVYESDGGGLKRRRNTPVNTTGKDGSMNLSELYEQLDEQNQLIADLTRKVEELSFALDQTKEQLSRRDADVDMRFRTMTDDFEKRIAESAAPTLIPGAPAVPQKKPDSVQSDGKTLPSSSKTDDLNEKKVYDAAYELLNNRKYEEAEKAFTNFIKTYPNSKLTGNANYWLGETYYVRGKYEIAAGVFSDGLTRYESNVKAPDNLLKLGLTMARLDKQEEACGFLTLLPEKFPNAEMTLKKRADEERKKLACP